MKTSTSTSRSCFLASVILLVAGACGRPDVSQQPILEQTASHSMQLEVVKAASAVEAALPIVESNPKDTAIFLRAADRALRHLLDFYIPMMEAREHSYNALVFFNLGKIDNAEEELNQVESSLRVVAQCDHGQLLREMEPPLEILEDSRTAVRADPVMAAELLRSLTNRLNNMMVKGGLIVD